MNIEEEWENFCNDNNMLNDNKKKECVLDTISNDIPKCSPIYISTKTKIIYLSKEIELKENFWKIPIIDYSNPMEGVIKKQMKYCFDDMDEVDGEGYVMWNRWGIYKLVDRDEFSRLNFLTGGDWTVNKVS